MRQLGILGASGNLGRLLINEALAHDWAVRAITRTPAKLRMANDNLTVFQGDAETGEGLQHLIGCRAVMYAVNSKKPSECVSHIVKVVADKGKSVQRVVFVSRVGVGASAMQGQRVSGPLQRLVPRVQKQLFDELGQAEELMRLSGLPYSIFRTTRIVDALPNQELAVVPPDAPPPSRIGRSALARFLIQSLEEPKWSMQELTVGTVRR